MVLAFAQPWHPIIFEEVRKEVFFHEFTKAHSVQQRHIFSKVGGFNIFMY
jgi:hypothetical protein